VAALFVKTQTRRQAQLVALRGRVAVLPWYTARQVTTMIDEKLARFRLHRNSIGRYRRLLKTTLTDLERDFIEQRLSEEQSAMEALAASTFLLSFA
jgi:hypothetical protein